MATKSRSVSAGELSLRVIAGLLALFLGLPVVFLVVRSVATGALANAVTTPVVLDALQLSLITTSISLVITIGFGLPLAFVMARRRSAAPASWKPSSTSRSCSRRPSPASACSSCSAAAASWVSRLASCSGSRSRSRPSPSCSPRSSCRPPSSCGPRGPGSASVPRELEDAARVDGAGELYLFRRITVPIARAALAAGLVMTWARSLGEFGATIMFAGNFPGKTQTLPLVVYSEFNSGDLDASIAAAAILVLAAFGVLIAVRVLHWGRILDDRSLG